MFHRVQLNIFSLLFLALFLANAAVFQSLSLGVVLLGLYVAIFGWELGGVLVGSEKAILRWWVGMWGLLCAIMIVLTASYYLWAITSQVVMVVILLTPAVVLWTTKHFPSRPLFSHAHDLWREHRHRLPSRVWLVLALSIFLLALFFTILGTSDHGRGVIHLGAFAIESLPLVYPGRRPCLWPLVAWP